MNQSLSRYLGFALAAIIGATGVALINNNKPNITPSGTAPAVSAQPFPGLGIPAIPATPAKPPEPRRPQKNTDVLVVFAPAGGRGWVRGSGLGGSLPISWIWNSTKPEKSGLTFEVNLLKGGKFFRKIATVTIPSVDWLGQMRWEIPSDIPVGSDYNVEVYESKQQRLRDVNDLPISILGETVTVSGRFIDGATNQPMRNVTISARPNYGFPDTSTNANGEFSYVAKTTFPGYDDNWNNYYFVSPECSMPASIGPWYSLNTISGPNTSNGMYTYNIGTYDMFVSASFVEGDRRWQIPILSDHINVGDIKTRPVGNISVRGDFPFSMMVDWADSMNQLEGAGTGGYYPSSFLQNVFPINYDTRVILTDQSGKTYTSPWHQVGVEARCKTVPVTFTNGQFSWGQIQDGF